MLDSLIFKNEEMKKKIQLILIILLNISILHSQNYWEYFYRNNSANNDYDESIANLEEINNGDIITVGLRFDKNEVINSIIRLHLGQSGEVYREENYSIDSLETSLRWIFYDTKSEIFTIIGSAHYEDTINHFKRGYFLITRWNKDLNLLRDTIFPLEPIGENYYLWYFSGNYTENGNYLIHCKYNKNYKDVRFGNIEMSLLINKKGEIIKKYVLKDNVFTGQHCSIVEDNKRNGYMVIGSTTYMLDSNFVVKDSILALNTDKYINLNHTTVRMFAPDTLLLTARINDFHRGLAFLTFDSEYINYVKSVDLTTKEGNPIEVLLVHRAMDYQDSSIIYVVSQDNHFSYFTVSKVNSILEPYWIKYCSENDTLTHYLYSMVATKDSGCIVAGTRARIPPVDGKSLKYGAWMQKFDSDGNTVSTTELAPNAWSITVYPNPSSGEFSINIEGKAQNTKLELYDMQGRVVKRFTGLIQGKNRLDMYDIPHGIYVWQLSRAGKILGTGKWVKE